MKKRIEIYLLRLVIWLLNSRNVARSPYVSRYDNNRLWGFAESIEQIIERMQNGYASSNYVLGQEVHYDGSPVTIAQLYAGMASVRTRQGNLLTVRYEFLTPNPTKAGSL